MPRFWIVAGPNGSGKSTLVDSGAVNHLLGADLVYLNADVRTRQILDADPGTSNANLTAAIEIDARVASCIDHGTDFVVETVLSSDKYLDDIERALRLGYELGLIYVCLKRPADSVRRVVARREDGGHDVPPDRIVARWYRSIAILGRIAMKMHRLYVYDNTSTHGPILIAANEGQGLMLLSPGRIPEIDAVLTAGLDSA
jgi:predicted ABC-type ATPase